jgi:hypothetical protein
MSVGISLYEPAARMAAETSSAVLMSRLRGTESTMSSAPARRISSALRRCSIAAEILGWVAMPATFYPNSTWNFVVHTIGLGITSLDGEQNLTVIAQAHHGQYRRVEVPKLRTR